MMMASINMMMMIESIKVKIIPIEFHLHYLIQILCIIAMLTIVNKVSKKSLAFGEQQISILLKIVILLNNGKKIRKKFFAQHMKIDLMELLWRLILQSLETKKEEYGWFLETIGVVYSLLS